MIICFRKKQFRFPKKTNNNEHLPYNCRTIQVTLLYYIKYMCIYWCAKWCVMLLLMIRLKHVCVYIFSHVVCFRARKLTQQCLCAFVCGTGRLAKIVPLTLYYIVFDMIWCHLYRESLLCVSCCEINHKKAHTGRSRSSRRERHLSVLFFVCALAKLFGVFLLATPLEACFRSQHKVQSECKITTTTTTVTCWYNTSSCVYDQQVAHVIL